MATIAIVWELGGGLGHISRLLQIAQYLKRQGHLPILVIRDLPPIESVFNAEGIECLQAPFWRGQYTHSSAPISFTETLLRVGYHSGDALASLLVQWLSVYARIDPDLILFDHSPTAMLASRRLDCPKIQIGTSFSVLPHTVPLPRYASWMHPSCLANKCLRESEKRCIANINNALDKINAPKISAVHKLFDTDHTFIDTHPVLDVYGERKNVEYMGVFRRADIGITPVWPCKDRSKIFVYLKSHYIHAEALLQACTISGAQYLIYSTDLCGEVVQRYTSTYIRFSDQPFRINEIAQSCDVSINHAGSLSELLLQQGKPQLLLPMNTEQMMRAKKIASLNAAQLYEPKHSPNTLIGHIRDVLDNVSFNHDAMSIVKILAMNSDDVQKVCHRIDDLLGE